MKHWLMHVLVCVVIFAAAAAAEGPNRRSTRSKQEAEKKTDVCKLLTSADIEGVQGERVEEAKPSAQSGGGLVMSQCLFRTPTPSKSVSLAVAEPSAEKPSDFWRKQFHSSAEKQEPKNEAGKARKKSSREEEESRPRAIKDVGDEAYWVGGPITGALYVLRNNTFIRVSVGGVREEPARIEKSVALARAALKRL